MDGKDNYRKTDNDVQGIKLLKKTHHFKKNKDLSMVIATQSLCFRVR
jgi:hypothetical protein